MDQMSLNEKLKNLLDQGISASKDFAAKAESKTRELGEQGVILIDIKQLENRQGKLKNLLGEETYRALVERKEDSVDRYSPSVAAILDELDDLKEAIERKKAELKERRG